MLNINDSRLYRNIYIYIFIEVETSLFHLTYLIWMYFEKITIFLIQLKTII